MQIVIAGGTGFLGRHLVATLARQGHDVAVLTRTPRAPHHVAWTPDGSAGDWASALEGADAVVNLAGESIGERRWTRTRKERLVASRLDATRSLAAAIRGCTRPPAAFVTNAATGYYGAHGDEPITESAGAGTDFLAGLCVAWEDAARHVDPSATRIVILRAGVVLARDGGALQKMLLPFRLGFGGPFGSGRQYVPWIHRDDWTALVLWLLGRPAAAGTFNATAPSPVTSRAFATALGRALGRPARLPAPAFALRLALGEMARPLLLEGQRALPTRAIELGFTFRYPTVEEALGEILKTVDGRR